MKHLLKILIVVCMAGGAGSAQTFTNHFDKLTTISGDEYLNVKAKRIENENLLIVHSKGVGRIPLEQLSDELKDSLGLPTKSGEEPKVVEQNKPTFPIVTQKTSVFVQPTNTFDWGWADGYVFFPEQDSPIINTQDWKKTRDQCEATIVQLAKEKELDHKLLAACLTIVMEDKRNKNLAIIPVAACQINEGEKTVWVISCVWEIASWVERKEFTESLGHIRAFAVSEDTKKIVAFMTCD